MLIGTFEITTAESTAAIVWNVLALIVKTIIIYNGQRAIGSCIRYNWC